jgi:hypothetical protein
MKAKYLAKDKNTPGGNLPGVLYIALLERWSDTLIHMYYSEAVDSLISGTRGLTERIGIW